MSDETRERIVAGAYRALVKGGYHATSIKDIAEEAGVAPGLVHYYFETKEDLLVAAIEHGCAAIEVEWEHHGLGLSGNFPPTKSPLELASLGFELAKADLRRRRGLFLLVFDMFGVGLHNPKIAAAVSQFIQERRSLIEAIARAVIRSLPQPPASRPEAIAAAIWAGINGITLQKLIDKNFDADAAIDALAEMVFAFVQLPVREGV